MRGECIGHRCQANGHCETVTEGDAPFCPDHWKLVSDDLRNELLRLQRERARQPTDRQLRRPHMEALNHACIAARGVS